MNNILLVVDVQKGFQRNQETIENAVKISSLIRSKVFDKVISTKFINRPESPYSKWLKWPRLLREPDTELMEELQEYSDIILEKYYYNCEKDSLVRALINCNEGIFPEKVFICGTDTDCCIQINAATLFEMKIHPIVLVNYCASNGGCESHKAGVTVMKRTLGRKHLISGEIHSKEDICKIWEKVSE